MFGSLTQQSHPDQVRISQSMSEQVNIGTSHIPTKSSPSNLTTGRRSPVQGSLTDIFGGLHSKTQRMSRLLRPSQVSVGFSDKKHSNNPTHRQHPANDRLNSRSEVYLNEEEQTKKKENLNQIDQESPIFGTWGKTEEASLSILQSPQEVGEQNEKQQDFHFQFSSFSGKPRVHPTEVNAASRVPIDTSNSKADKGFSTPPKRQRMGGFPETRSLATQLFPAKSEHSSSITHGVAALQGKDPLEAKLQPIRQVDQPKSGEELPIRPIHKGPGSLDPRKIISEKIQLKPEGSYKQSQSVHRERPSDQLVEDHLNTATYWTGIPHLATFGGTEGSTAKKIFATKTSHASSEKQSRLLRQEKGTYYHPGTAESQVNDQTIYERILMNIRFTKRAVDESVEQSSAKKSNAHICTHDLSPSPKKQERASVRQQQRKHSLCTRCKLQKTERGRLPSYG